MGAWQRRHDVQSPSLGGQRHFRQHLPVWRHGQSLLHSFWRQPAKYRSLGRIGFCFSDDGLFYGAEFTGTGLPPYSAVIADVGTDHLLAAWTNNAGQNNMGGIEYWTPVDLTTQASFTENQSTLSPVTYVLPNATVYLIATPSPLSGIQGVAYQDADSPATWTPYTPAPNGSMFAGTDNSQGYPSYWYVGPLTAPSTAGTYTMKSQQRTNPIRRRRQRRL